MRLGAVGPKRRREPVAGDRRFGSERKHCEDRLGPTGPQLERRLVECRPERSKQLQCQPHVGSLARVANPGKQQSVNGASLLRYKGNKNGYHREQGRKASGKTFVPCRTAAPASQEARSDQTGRQNDRSSHGDTEPGFGPTSRGNEPKCQSSDSRGHDRGQPADNRLPRRRQCKGDQKTEQVEAAEESEDPHEFCFALTKRKVNAFSLPLGPAATVPELPANAGTRQEPQGMFSLMTLAPNVSDMAGGKTKSTSQQGPRLDKPKAKRARTSKEPNLVDRILAPYRWLVRWSIRIALALAVLMLLAVASFGVMNPPTTHTMWSEGRRLGEPVDYTWVDASAIAPVMLRSAVAAEDANFCLHWGFDVEAIQAAIEAGGTRGASTISQQVVKNVFLWQERSWVRKGFEAILTPIAEAMWSKRRILELYLNVAEFDEGVFGVQAAAVHYFGVDARDLTPLQAARLAAVLPSPKKRSASQPSDFVERRARSIRGGAETIRQDGRAACFQE